MAEVELPNPTKSPEHHRAFPPAASLPVACFMGAVPLAITRSPQHAGPPPPAKERMLAPAAVVRSRAYFQAKSIRESEIIASKNAPRLDRANAQQKHAPCSSKAAKPTNCCSRLFAQEERRRWREKNGNRSRRSRELEKKRHHLNGKKTYYDLGRILLHIAIVNGFRLQASRSRPGVLVSAALAAIGIPFPDRLLLAPESPMPGGIKESHPTDYISSKPTSPVWFEAQLKKES